MNESDEIKANEAASQTSPEPTRNAVVKTALTTAAGVAVGAVLTENAEAQANAPKTGHIRIIVSEGGIDVKTLDSAIYYLLRKLQPNGCTVCGLLGFDLSILRGDPPFAVNPQAGLIQGIETVG